jgi:hypothetical protein
MKLFELQSQEAVELRAAQQMLMQFARLKSSQPIEGLGAMSQGTREFKAGSTTGAFIQGTGVGK